MPALRPVREIAPLAEVDRERVTGLLLNHCFATLVSVRNGRPLASPLPLLFDPAPDGAGRLYGHLPRSNPLAAFAPDESVLALFTGPHAYVSPGWTAAPALPGWNYCAVQARGRVRVLADPAQRAAVVLALGRRFDADDAQGDGQAPDLPGGVDELVAFVIEIEDLEGDFRLSRQHSPEDRQRIIAKLGQDDHPDVQALSGLMLEDLLRDALPGGAGE